MNTLTASQWARALAIVSGLWVLWLLAIVTYARSIRWS